jgi:hypothetical protein
MQDGPFYSAPSRISRAVNLSEASVLVATSNDRYDRRQCTFKFLDFIFFRALEPLGHENVMMYTAKNGCRSSL